MVAIVKRSDPTFTHDGGNDDAARRFAEAMAALGPFERHPHLAVAVSGGPDSMALALLARDWAEAGGGRVTALIVDHGLRAGSDAEASGVVRRLEAEGIEAELLTWKGPKPETGVQEAARDMRYALLRDWCRENNVLHLLTGHQASDQAETYLMRRERRSDGPGLAGISALTSFPDLRIVRPLLGLQRDELREVLGTAGVTWINDPSNEDATFERVRVRRRLAHDSDLSSEVADAQELAGKARIELEAAVDAAAARLIRVHPLGFAHVDRRALDELSPDIRSALVNRLVTALGGAEHGPRNDRIDRLVRRLAQSGEFKGATLGHCRFVEQGKDRLLVCREARDLPDSQAARSGVHDFWDGRFRVHVSEGLPGGAVLAPMGGTGWRQLDKESRRSVPVPQAAVRSLPAIFRSGHLIAAPLPGAGKELKIRFRPKNSLAFHGFCIA